MQTCKEPPPPVKYPLLPRKKKLPNENSEQILVYRLISCYSKRKVLTALSKEFNKLITYMIYYSIQHVLLDKIKRRKKEDEAN